MTSQECLDAQIQHLLRGQGRDMTYNTRSLRLLIRTGRPERRHDILLRSAIVEDIPQILQLALTTDRFRVSRVTDGVDEEELRYWIGDERSLVLVAVDGPDIVAYAYGFYVSPKWFLFDAFCVSPSIRNSGLGKRMYAHLRELCKRRGADLVQGLVKDGDLRALAAWTARGFEEGSKCIWVEDWINEY